VASVAPNRDFIFCGKRKIKMEESIRIEVEQEICSICGKDLSALSPEENFVQVGYCLECKSPVCSECRVSTKAHKCE
jgi:hypothetical protein